MGAMGLPPDGSAVAFQEMQRKMLDMQHELERLRSAVGTEVVNPMNKPLTMPEKKDLISNIGSLPHACIDRVVQIVREGGTEGRDSGADKEIDLDDLDTYTLRRLQSYVVDTRAKQGILDNSHANKRARTSGPAGGMGAASALGPPPGGEYEDPALFNFT